jgi:hypothetical protein
MGPSLRLDDKEKGIRSRPAFRFLHSFFTVPFAGATT